MHVFVIKVSMITDSCVHKTDDSNGEDDILVVGTEIGEVMLFAGLLSKVIGTVLSNFKTITRARPHRCASNC